MLTPEKKPRWLRKLRLAEVSLVDFGANQHASVAVFKRRHSDLASTTVPPPTSPLHTPDLPILPTMKQKEATMAESTEFAKALQELAAADTKIVNLTAELRVEKQKAEEAAADTRAANRQLADLNIKFDQEVSKHADPEVELLKGMSEGARKAFLTMKADSEALRKSLASQEEATALSVIAKSISTDMAHLPVKAEDFAPVIKAARTHLPAEAMAELDRVLKAASGAFAEAKKVHGNRIVKTSTEGQIDKMAREKADADKITFEQAYTAVLKANPALYSAMMAEQSAAN